MDVKTQLVGGRVEIKVGVHVGDVRVLIEVSMHHARTELFKDLDRFEQQFRAAPANNSFRRWLKERRERHEDWLARL